MTLIIWRWNKNWAFKLIHMNTQHTDTHTHGKWLLSQRKKKSKKKLVFPFGLTSKLVGTTHGFFSVCLDYLKFNEHIQNEPNQTLANVRRQQAFDLTDSLYDTLTADFAFECCRQSAIIIIFNQFSIGFHYGFISTKCPKMPTK